MIEIRCVWHKAEKVELLARKELHHRVHASQIIQLMRLVFTIELRALTKDECYVLFIYVIKIKWMFFFIRL